MKIRFIDNKTALLWMIKIENTKTMVFKPTTIISKYSKNALLFVLDTNFHSPIIYYKMENENILFERLL